jgi:hypothetical protein
MYEITANVSFDTYADMPEFDGSGQAGYRLAMVKSREDFLDLFGGARHVDAITYAETPKLMVRMLTEYGVDTLDVLVGNYHDYADRVDDVSTARSLVRLRQDDRLTVRLKNQKIVHSKMYRIVMPDDTVKLVHGSANLSKTRGSTTRTKSRSSPLRPGQNLMKDLQRSSMITENGTVTKHFLTGWLKQSKTQTLTKSAKTASNIGSGQET